MGKIVEIADRDAIYEDALHPYARGLMSAIPVPDPAAKRKRDVIPQGEIPSPINPPPGCHFHTRCPKAFDRCAEEEPLFLDAGRGHMVACHLYSPRK